MAHIVGKSSIDQVGEVPGRYRFRVQFKANAKVKAVEKSVTLHLPDSDERLRQEVLELYYWWLVQPKSRGHAIPEFAVNNLDELRRRKGVSRQRARVAESGLSAIDKQKWRRLNKSLNNVKMLSRMSRL